MFLCTLTDVNMLYILCHGEHIVMHIVTYCVMVNILSLLCIL